MVPTADRDLEAVPGVMVCPGVVELGTLGHMHRSGLG